MSLSIASVVDRLYDSPRFPDHLLARSVYKHAQNERLGERPVREENWKVRVQVAPDLPMLAWVCTISGGRYDFTVGPGVDHGDGYVFEGVWDGAAGSHEFHRSEYVFGSGARFKRWAVFVPPRHCWEGLHVLRNERSGRTVISNSLPLGLAEMDIATDSSFFESMLDILRVSNDDATASGVDRYDPFVLQSDGYSLYRFLFDNVAIDSSGRMRIVSHEPVVPFATFHDYEAHLARVISDVAANGGQPSRRLPLRLITPISSGYDSPAVGALAARAGYRDAVTIDVMVKGRDDSGAAIGERLGLNVAKVPHVRGSEVPELAWRVDEGMMDTMTEFVATPGLGDDVALKTLEPYLAGRVLLSGAGGDSIWKRASTLPPGLPVRVVYGKSFTEFRLRVGFAFVPVPVVGGRYSYGVRKITRSPEMHPWTLNRPYDRPLARRLVEQAGVPRGTFAVHKAATNPTILNYRELVRPAFDRMISRYRFQLGR